MPWHEPWPLKLRRRIRKPFNRIFRSRHYYVVQYLGASFVLAPRGIGALEVSAKIWERPEIEYLMQRCATLKPDRLIDVGANIGVYSCVLLKNGCVPRAILFEPDRENRIRLMADLLINVLLDRAEVHAIALGEANVVRRLVPGIVVRSDLASADGGFSAIMDADAEGPGYEVEVVRFDDRFAIAGETLVIKIDVEHYECKALAGMERTLRDNHCLVLVESYAMREQVIAMMDGFGYEHVKEFTPNSIFENKTKSR